MLNDTCVWNNAPDTTLRADYDSRIWLARSYGFTEFHIGDTA